MFLCWQSSSCRAAKCRLVLSGGIQGFMLNF